MKKCKTACAALAYGIIKQRERKPVMILLYDGFRMEMSAAEEVQIFNYRGLRFS